MHAAELKALGGAKALARMLGTAVVVVPVLVLLGWFGEIETLKSVVPGWTPMNPLTALGFIMAGLSLWISVGLKEGSDRGPRRAAQGLAWGAVLVGAQRLVVYGLGHGQGLDQVLFASRLAGNRMAPNTATAFVLLGLALATLDMQTLRRWRPAVWLTLSCACLALFAITGYIYSVLQLYTFQSFIPMALNTAICFVTLSVGILCARPGREPVALIISPTAGGALARRLLPAAIVVPLLLGWLRLYGEQAGYLETQFAVSLFVLATMMVFIILIWLIARSIYRADMRRRAAEEALRASEAFYHSLVEHLPQNIFRKDLEGRFTFGNQRFCGEIRKSLEELKGKTDFDFFPPELAERYRHDDQVVQAGRIFETVEEHVTPLGEKLYVQVIKTPVYDLSGQVIGTQGIFWDVTDKKRSESELHEKNRLLEDAVGSEREAHAALKTAQSHLVQNEKLAALGQMVAGVAHEINNPLAFVSNNVAVLQRDVRSIRDLLTLYRQGDGAVARENAPLSAQIQELAERMDLDYTLDNINDVLARSREGMKRIQQIVRDLRDFARLDESDLHEVNLNAGIESTVNIIRGRAKKKNIEIEVALSPLPPVMCYPAKVNQVVMNLLANAIDACAENGKVAIRAPQNGTVQIEVSDNGQGIEPSIRDRIFDPFFTTKPPGEGTGLGLSISYGIVQDHGGEIEVDSTPGKGSRFTVRLPVRPRGKPPA